MIPKRIELENFLSFGKPAAAFTFTDDEPLWALCGRNGVGKSAVFDGITYALYGKHRGGKHKAEQLIRHGANGFRIVLEFEFAGDDYRITRVRAGRTRQLVERRVEGEWEAISGVNSAEDVEAWVERTLGLGYEAFTTSVLLRQGEAEKLFSASREDRIAVLKGIIGFEKFEAISERVHAATLNRGSTLDGLRRQVRALVPVTSEELTAAAATVAVAEQTWNEAQAAFTVATQRVEHAKQWSGLETRRGGLEQQLAAAEQRVADAPTIRAAKARLDDLSAAVPELASFVRLRDAIAVQEPNLAAAATTVAEAAVASEARDKAAGEARQKEAIHLEQAREFDRQGQALLEAVERDARFLQLADAKEAVRSQLAAFPADLVECGARAEADEKAASEARQAAAEELAAAAALLRQAREQRDRFADVAVGVTCSQCGQVVDEAHAVKERARIPAPEAVRRQSEAKEQSDAANVARDAAVRTRDGLQARAEQHRRLTAELRTTEREHDLHKKLDDLLGQNGLQRELVRDAEQQIVSLANDTLQHLSDGDLSLEQDDEAAGRDDKAFALRVRRAGDAIPIGVLFLSGSQKFRVAVSVALAVGRFASGRARPLEAVIIDEGFGSLDKDGLRAMADELKRLQRSQSLKRVILVSHQEEFTDQFPVGYRLSPDEGGTAATRFRR